MNAPQTDTQAKPGEDLDGKTLSELEGNGAKEESSDAPKTGHSRREERRERDADKAKRVGTKRFEQACEMADDLRHKRGCPEEGARPGEADRRVEHYTATKPRTQDAPPQEMLVVRCVECGEEEVAPDESENSA